MADEALAKAGLHFDELNKIRVLEPDVSQQTIELKDESKEFLGKLTEFKEIVGGFISVVDQVSKEVENEKMKAIGSRNLLKSISKRREADQQQLLGVTIEKKTQLERLRVQYEALLKEEQDQTEFIEQFILQK